MLEDLRGKDCAFVANCLRGKGLNKLCAVFEGVQILILDSDFEYMNVLSCVYLTIIRRRRIIEVNNCFSIFTRSDLNRIRKETIKKRLV